MNLPRFVKASLATAAVLLLGGLATACVSASSDSCQVAPAGGQDTRIYVNGTNAGSACQSISSQLGPASGGWNVQGQSTLPSDDARQMCSGMSGGATYVVWDHILFNGTGYSACQTLGATFTGESPSPG
jgi:hypothetical protein